MVSSFFPIEEPLKELSDAQLANISEKATVSQRKLRFMTPHRPLFSYLKNLYEIEIPFFITLKRCSQDY